MDNLARVSDNDTVVENVFDAASLGAATVASVSYTLNNTGNRTSETRQDGNTRNFAYDLVDRLLSSTNTLLSENDEVFSYDPEGNWINNGQIHDDFNQLLEDNDWTYTYDPEGNLTGKTSTTDASDIWTYTWDAANRLVKVEHQSVTVAEYAYDAMGRRIAKTTS